MKLFSYVSVNAAAAFVIHENVVKLYVQVAVFVLLSKILNVSLTMGGRILFTDICST